MKTDFYKVFDKISVIAIEIFTRRSIQMNCKSFEGIKMPI